MPEEQLQDKNFYIGICMAGAVSAGAYTAGVMDYLLEALTEWEKRKKEGAPNTPKHNVVIPTLGGASAGGMTAIITACALNNPISPITEPPKNLADEKKENKLYHTWVDQLQKEMFPLLLDTNDMEKESIVSLLNSSFIDKLADASLQVDKKSLTPLPSFISPNLKIFATLTNLEGFSYNVAFKTFGNNSDKYYMAIHNDYACFKMNSNTEVEDGWMDLDFRNDINVDVAKQAAMATGAFPVGLKTRRLKRKSAHVNRIIWDNDTRGINPVSGEDCDTLNVDGGVINNEPFDKVRDILTEITGEKKDDYQNEKTFRSTVLMVDPFPSKRPKKFDYDQKLFHVVGLTLNAMLEQMRAKPEQLSSALDTKCPGQFLIAPTRRRRNFDGVEQDVGGDQAIACGSLSGFGGFIEKEFRVHDYFLGRFNCEMFLRNYFTVSAAAVETNPIFRKGYNDIDKEQFKGENGTYQIIPIFTPNPEPGYFPIPTFKNGTNWPILDEKKIEGFRKDIKKRVQALIMNALKLKWYNKIFVWIGAKVVLNRTLTNAAISTIKKSLHNHQLMPLNKEKIKEINEEGN
ncbi:MAG TPA: patatin-like phospholipase family protein [Segetibacter sp.]|nr:patatin-like phospholipase family protein [Segetibacter sp.]